MSKVFLSNQFNSVSKPGPLCSEIKTNEIDFPNNKTNTNHSKRNKINNLATSTNSIKEIAKEFKSTLGLSKRLSQQLESEIIYDSNKTKKEKRSKSILDHEFLTIPDKFSNYNMDVETFPQKDDDFFKHRYDCNTNRSIINEKKLSINILDEKNIKVNKRSNSIYSRQIVNVQLQNQKREILLFQKRQEEILKTLKTNPQILTKKKNFDSKDQNPLYKRIKQVVDNKNTMLCNLKCKINEIREQKNINESTPLIPTKKFDSERFENWIEVKKNYNINKEKKLQMKREERKIDDIDDLTYIPKINFHSRKLVEKVKTVDSVYAKLYKDSKIQSGKLRKKIRDLTPSFTPIINRKYHNNLPRCSSDLKDERLRSMRKKLSNENLSTLKFSTISTSAIDSLPVKTHMMSARNSDRNVNYDSLSGIFKIKNKSQKNLNTINYDSKTDRTMGDNLYKININDGGACDINKENNVFYFPTVKFNNFLKSFLTIKK